MKPHARTAIQKRAADLTIATAHGIYTAIADPCCPCHLPAIFHSRYFDCHCFCDCHDQPSRAIRLFHCLTVTHFHRLGGLDIKIGQFSQPHGLPRSAFGGTTFRIKRWEIEIVTVNRKPRTIAIGNRHGTQTHLRVEW